MAHTGNKTGRPTKIGEIQESAILAALSVGASLIDAAACISVDPDTIMNYRKAHRAFSVRVDRAIHKGKVRLIKKVGTAKPWQAAAWMLERKWGAEFGKHDKVEHGGSITLLPMKLDGGRDMDFTRSHEGNGHANSKTAADADAVSETGGGHSGNGAIHRN